MEKQFPVVISVRTVIVKIDFLFWEGIECDHIAVQGRIEILEKRRGQGFMEIGIQQACQRLLVEFGDQFSDVGVEKVLEGVRELRVLAIDVTSSEVTIHIKGIMEGGLGTWRH